MHSAKKLEPYSGVLNRPSMSPEAGQAYGIFRTLVYKNKKRGFDKTDIDVRHFISWWIDGLKKYKGKTRLTVGRLDHSKGYFWDNIELQSQSDNSREAMTRNKIYIHSIPGTVKRSIVEVKLFDKTGTKHIATISSHGETAKLFGVSSAYINALLFRKRMKPNFRKIPFILRAEKRNWP